MLGWLISISKLDEHAAVYLYSKFKHANPSYFTNNSMHPLLWLLNILYSICASFSVVDLCYVFEFFGG